MVIIKTFRILFIAFILGLVIYFVANLFRITTEIIDLFTIVGVLFGIFCIKQVYRDNAAKNISNPKVGIDLLAELKTQISEGTDLYIIKSSLNYKLGSINDLEKIDKAELYLDELKGKKYISIANDRVYITSEGVNYLKKHL